MTEPWGTAGRREVRTDPDELAVTHREDRTAPLFRDRTAPLPQDPADPVAGTADPVDGVRPVDRDWPADRVQPVERVEQVERVDHVEKVDHVEQVEHRPAVSAADLGLDRRSVMHRERDQFGGIKWGSAFFGWLAATGTAVLLTALLTAFGAAIGISSNGSTSGAVAQAANNAATIGLVGGIALLVVLFVAYYCGGYVAGRMARFNGLRQGLAVWVWALGIAIVVGVVGALAGSRWDILGALNSFPRIPVDTGQVTTGGLIALLLAVGVTLLGALLGGLAGMRFHRRVDRAGLDAPIEESTLTS